MVYSIVGFEDGVGAGFATAGGDGRKNYPTGI